MALSFGDCEIRAAHITIPDLDAFLCRLRNIMSGNDATIICFNAANMAGTAHVRAALRHASRSFRSGAPIAKSLEMEALLYAAGTRQCALAGEAVGIREGENKAYVCCCPPRPEIWELLQQLMRFTDEDWEAFDAGKRERLCQIFSISQEEITAAGGEARLADLVIERVALLDAYR